MKSIGFVFMTLGIAFVAIGANGENTFLWSGSSFLFIGILGLGLSRKESAADAAERNTEQASADNNSRDE